MNYYELLGISEDASSEEIKQAYRSNIKEWHPDLHPDKPDAAAKTQEINEAYGILSDPVKRSKYDEYLAYTRPCKITPLRKQDDSVSEQATAEDYTDADVDADAESDYSNMSFEDYVKNVAHESYSTYNDAFNGEKHKFDERGSGMKFVGSVLSSVVSSVVVSAVVVVAAVVVVSSADVSEVSAGLLHEHNSMFPANIEAISRIESALVLFIINPLS